MKIKNKKIFIDCGTHCFQGFNQFVEKYNIDSTWECYCFEANPITYKKSKNEYEKLISNRFNISYFNKAVYNKNDQIKVNCSLEWDNDPKNILSYSNQGSNVLDTPPSMEECVNRNYEYNNQDVLVESINFSEFILNHCNFDDYVLIKMDIEGSEFNVLNSLIDTESYKLINEIYCEWHHRFFEDRNKYIEMSKNIKKIFLDNNISFYDWV
jgi:FkbM family methyltransferase